MRLNVELFDDDTVLFGPPPAARLLGLEALRSVGRWPTLRHVFDAGDDAGLYVDVGPLAELTVYAVGYSWDGDENLLPL